jgi:hypothetical protein
MTEKKNEEFPEHAKLLASKAEREIVGEFLDWLTGVREIVLCKSTGNWDCPYVPVNGSFQKLMAEYFKIDMDKVEQETAVMLDRMRAIVCSPTLKGERCEDQRTRVEWCRAEA